jgi:hypothetical protein
MNNIWAHRPGFSCFYLVLGKCRLENEKFLEGWGVVECWHWYIGCRWWRNSRRELHVQSVQSYQLTSSFSRRELWKFGQTGHTSNYLTITSFHVLSNSLVADHHILCYIIWIVESIVTETINKWIYEQYGFVYRLTSVLLMVPWASLSTCWVMMLHQSLMQL